MSFTFNKRDSEFTHPIAKIHKETDSGRIRKTPIYYTFGDGIQTIKGEVHLTYATEKNQVNQIAIYGSPGSGKSHAARDIMKAIRTHDKRDWAIFSAKEEDSLFDDIDWLYRYPIDEIEDLRIEDFQQHEFNAIFDDYDSFLDKATNDYMIKLIRAILKRGRSLGINIIIITQQGKNGKDTKAVNDLFNQVVLFPSSNKTSTLDFLKTKMAFSKKQLDDISNLPKSRFQKLVVRRQVPQFIFTDGQLIVLE